MRETLKRLFKLTAGYSLVTLLGPLFTIFLTPLYTKALSPADYGVLDVALTLTGLITVFSVIGLDQALNSYFYNIEAAQRRDLVTTALVCTAGVGTLLALGLALLAGPLAERLYHDFDQRLVLLLLALNVASVALYTVIAAALRLQMDVKRVNILVLFVLLMTVASNVWLVVVLQLKVPGAVLANILTYFTVALLGLILAWKPFHGQFRFSWLKPLLWTGLTLLPGSLSLVLLSNVDRLLLTQYVSTTDIGLYSIANKLTTMSWVLINAAWVAWLAIALEMVDQPDAPRQYARMFEYFAVTSMLLALGIGIFAPEILAIFTRDVYVPAASFTLVLLIGTPLGIMCANFQIGLYARKRTILISLAIIAAAIVNISLNLMLNPVIGVWGAVIATVLSGVVLWVIQYLTSRRVMAVPYRLARVFVVMAVYLGLTMAFVTVPLLDKLVFKIGALAILLLAVLLTGIITIGQIKAGLLALRAWLGQRHLGERAS